MPMLLIIVGFIALMVAAPFVGGRYTPTQSIPFDHQSDIDSRQIETFARAAWWAARGTGSGVMSGTIPRTALSLPPNFQDNPSYPYQAWSDGQSLWVWTADPSPMAQRLSAPFQGIDNADAVSVGLSNASTVAWRYGGTSSPRPAAVTFPSLVVRVQLP
jgi:hypothetical protein